MLKYLAAAAIAAAALIDSPAAAHADDQGYLNELHQGIAPATLYDQFGLQNAQGPAIVTAAQHNICPDTLH